MSKVESESDKVHPNLRRLLKSGAISTHSNQSKTQSSRDEVPEADVHNNAKKPEYEQKSDEEPIHRGYVAKKPVRAPK